MRWGLLIGLCLALVSTQARAWNDQGHMMVAAVAWERLTPAARQKVSRLLRQNPQYGTWIAGVPAQQRDEIAFLRAATWPDFIKSAPGYVMDGNTPSGPDAARNIGYSDHLQHRYWHFKDLPYAIDGAAAVAPPTVNAAERIALFSAALRSPGAPGSVKSYDLVWLIHLVGDIHQPLHATSRYSPGSPHGDNGGNGVHVSCQGCPGNLHAVWDDILGQSRDPGAALGAIHGLKSPPANLVAVRDPKVWADESYKLAVQWAYHAPIGKGPGPFPLDPGYVHAAHDIAADRVALAGWRLAALIEGSL